jgi:tRNA(Ile)-lysidine synthase
MDSSVLLHLLAGERDSGAMALSALHVNHGLSPNALAWEDHCHRACRDMDIDLRVVRVDVKHGPGESLEEQARRARYAAFAESDAYAVAMAHHADDQAETVLLQMLRGAGPKGLAAMAEFSGAPASPAVWRPLLDIPRAEIVAFARSTGITWIEDESNLNPGHKRNFLRLRVWPVLAQGFPSAARSIARVAGLQADAAALLGDLADIDLATIESVEGLDCNRLKALTARRRANLLRRWIVRQGVRAPSAARLAALMRAIDDSSNDTRLTWLHENLRVCRRRAYLVIEMVAGDLIA